MNDENINKGIELMLRRVKKEESKRMGLIFNKSFNLLSKTIFLKFEFTWEANNHK